jgi:hypothetical protein
MKHLIYALVPLAVSGCAGGIGIGNSALTGALAGIAPTLTVEQILENAALYHNLRVQLNTIDAMGIVTTTTQTPVVVSGTPLTPPAPVTPAPSVVVPPAPPAAMPPPSGGPVVTPSARYRHRTQSIGRTVPDAVHADFGWDKWGRPVTIAAE